MVNVTVRKNGTSRISERIFFVAICYVGGKDYLKDLLLGGSKWWVSRNASIGSIRKTHDQLGKKPLWFHNIPPRYFERKFSFLSTKILKGLPWKAISHQVIFAGRQLLFETWAKLASTTNTPRKMTTAGTWEYGPLEREKHLNQTIMTSGVLC